jgi:hypothetical protein
MMDETTKMAISASIRAMFDRGWVSISDIDQCLKVANIIPPRRPHELLRTLHCVKLADMPRELAEKVPVLLAECFNGLDVDELLRACTPAGRQLEAPRRVLN